MDTMKPRIIQTESGVIDATKVVHVEAVEEMDTQLFRFYVVSDRREFTFTSSDQGKLQEVRRRLIDFIWPNADVFLVNTTP
jgi:hypothetical protein